MHFKYDREELSKEVAFGRELIRRKKKAVFHFGENLERGRQKCRNLNLGRF